MPNEAAVRTWDEKIAELEKAEAVVSGAAAKFEIKKELEEARAKRLKLLQEGVQDEEIGWDEIDPSLLQAFFNECLKYDHYFEPMARGDSEATAEFLVKSAFGYRSSNGGVALTDQGTLFCTRRESIPRGKIHVHVHVGWRSGKESLQHVTWGSILFLRSEIKSRLDSLSARSVGNPEKRNESGGQTLVYEYPPKVIDEALTNFLIHRDYGEDDHGRINIFPDRIEFVNPGMSLTPVEDLLRATEPLAPRYRQRNPRIIEATNMARWNEKEGSGILRIRQQLEENGSFLSDGSIGLKLWNDEDKNRFHLVVYKRDLIQVRESVPLRIAPTRLRHVAERLFGRDAELARLDSAWDDPNTHVLTLVAWGGVGKTSLVAKWAAKLARRDYDGARYFDWSFYSQGTRETGGPSSDTFVSAALTFFGDAEMAKSSASAWDKGTRLAQLVAARRTLLVLDGLEPLQHPPGPLAGQLKDPAVTALLKGLATTHRGLCVVTTRESVADLAPFRDTTAPEWELGHLSTSAGVELLETLGVHGAHDDLARLVADVAGHALTLQLLGGYLSRAHGGDVRRRDRVRLEKADLKTQGGHAFKTMAAYESWFTSGGEELAVLRVLGLFDRPADAGCLSALRRKPTIPGLTEPLVGLDEDDWNFTVRALADCGLVSPSSTEGSSLDAHPLIREYFARQLRQINTQAWRDAHGRLFEHLRDSTAHRPDTLEGLQPLYQAVGHGCRAGRQQEACDEVYFDRILRGQEFYSTRKLGAFGADLGAVACFFEAPWSRVSSSLTQAAQAWLLNEAALRLRALGRLTEALEPMRAGLQMRVEQETWPSAAIIAGNLSELELMLGDVHGAVRDAEHSVVFADRGGDAFERMAFRATLADALHQAGRRADALARFREAEQMQAERQPAYPLLYSQGGFRYGDLLLAEAERAAWQAGSVAVRAADGGKSRQDAGAPSELVETCRDVEQRAAMTLEWVVQNNMSLLDVALNHLTLGRAGLYRTILEQPDASALPLAPSATLDPKSEIEQAVDGLRRAGAVEFVVRGLLTRAWLRHLTGDADGARTDLAEAREIAERGPMPLFLADVDLYRARLFGDREALAASRRRIEEHGYGRRLEELADAEASSVDWPGPRR